MLKSNGCEIDYFERSYIPLIYKKIHPQNSYIMTHEPDIILEDLIILQYWSKLVVFNGLRRFTPK